MPNKLTRVNASSDLPAACNPGFTLSIRTGNAAFEDNLRGEVARILLHTAQLIRDGYYSGPLRDINGNSVGSFELTQQN